MAKETLLITGAAGGVATQIRPYLRQRYHLVLSDRTAPIADIQDGESWQTADLTDRGALSQLVDGVAGVVHLGGQSVEADWATVRDANFDGLFNILEACREKSVKRFIFASSNHAMGFYPRAETVGVDRPVRPDGYYGVSKAFGEAICSLYADKHGMRILSVRIGNIGPKPLDARRLAIWLHPEDFVSLVEIGLTHPDIHHAIVYGASDNARGWWDTRAAAALGYVPKHRSEDFKDEALAAQAELPADPIGDLFQGGTFASHDFDGDLDRSLKARQPE